jgi:hypothetical protein
MPPAPKKAPIAFAAEVPKELGEYIARDVELLQQLGWRHFVQQRRLLSDFSDLCNVHHPAAHLLHHYKHWGAPVKFSTPPWTKSPINQALRRGPHKSCHENVDFLHIEFSDMIERGSGLFSLLGSPKISLAFDYLLLVLYLNVINSPDGLVTTVSMMSMMTLFLLQPWRPCSLAMLLTASFMTFCLLTPPLGWFSLSKDISNGFYCVELNIDDIPKLGLIFPTSDGEEPLFAFPLVRPWVGRSVHQFLALPLRQLLTLPIMTLSEH